MRTHSLGTHSLGSSCNSDQLQGDRSILSVEVSCHAMQRHAMISQRHLSPSALGHSRIRGLVKAAQPPRQETVTCLAGNRWSGLVAASNSSLRETFGKSHVPGICLAALLACTSLPCDGASLLTSKPILSPDYATVVRKREGKAKSHLPTSKEAEALLEINEDLFTTEALEGMSRYLLLPCSVYTRTFTTRTALHMRYVSCCCTTTVYKH